MRGTWVGLLALAFGCSGPEQPCKSVFVAQDGPGLHAPAEARVGSEVRSTVALGSRDETRTACFEATASGPSGTVVAQLVSTDAGLEHRFTPDGPGTWRLDVRALGGTAGGSSFRTLVEVTAPRAAAVPCQSLGRPCARLERVGTTLACDRALLSSDGGVLAELDAGFWAAADGQLYGWFDGALHAVALDGGAWSVSAEWPTPAPDAWSLRAGVFAGSFDGGLFVLALADGGLSLRPAPSPSAVFVMRNGEVRTLTDVCRHCGFRPDQVVAASADAIAVYERDLSYQGGSFFVFDAGAFSYEPQSRSTARLWRPGSGARVLRNSLDGLQLVDLGGADLGAPMQLEGFTQAGAGEDFVWLSAPGQTQLFCQ